MDKVIRINFSDTVNDDQTTVSTEKDNSNNKNNNNNKDAASDDHTLIIEEDDDDDDDDDLKIFCQRRRRRRRRRRRVSFDRIYIREHPRIVGDHPAVKYGPALAIDWYNSNNNDEIDNNDHQPASISDSFVSSSVPCSITSSASASLSSQFHCVETSVDDYERIRSSVRKRGSELVLTSIDREKILHEWDIIKTTPSIQHQRLDDDWSLCHYPSSYHYTTWVPRLVNNDDINDNDNDSNVNCQSYHMKQLSPLFSRKIIESVTACVTHDNEQQHITSPLLFCQGMLDDNNGVLLNDDFLLDSTSSTSHQYLRSSIDQVEFNKYYCQDDNDNDDDDDDNNVSLQNESGNGIINNNNNNNLNDNQLYNDDANQSFGMFDSMTSTHIKVFILEN